MYDLIYYLLNLLILSQRITPFPVKPSKHVQVIVLVGVVEKTLHSAFATHGRMVEQGSTHLFLPPSVKQISNAGQSTSVLHSRLTGSGGGTK